MEKYFNVFIEGTKSDARTIPTLSIIITVFYCENTQKNIRKKNESQQLYTIQARDKTRQTKNEKIKREMKFKTRNPFRSVI